MTSIVYKIIPSHIKKLFNMKQLECLKDAFIEALDGNIVLYKIIGCGSSESPIWMQLGAISPQEKGLTFVNSQNRGIQFTIDCPDDIKRFIMSNRDETYDYFKSLKYFHIKENHPTIWDEIDSFNKARIESFIYHTNYKII